jgi:hypothetical protein
MMSGPPTITATSTNNPAKQSWDKFIGLIGRDPDLVKGWSGDVISKVVLSRTDLDPLEQADVLDYWKSLQAPPPVPQGGSSTAPSQGQVGPIVDQGVAATTFFNMFINGVADSSVQHLLQTLFAQIPLVDVNQFSLYSNHFVRNIPFRSGRFNMLHSEIKHLSKEATVALAHADVHESDDTPLVVLLGVSGAGKTRTAYEIAKERYTVYFEATTVHSTDLTAATKEMKEQELRIPPPEDPVQIAASRDRFEACCAQITNCLILARILTLLLLYGSKKVTTPTDWLLVQLNGGGTMSANIFNKLVGQFNQFSNVLQAALATWQVFFGQKMTIITDEAHLLLHELPGAFRRPSYKTRSLDETYSPNKGVKPSQSRSFLSFWITSLCALPILPIVCGTALRLRHLELIRSAAGRTEKLPIVVKDFPYLDQGKVEDILHFHLDLVGIPDTEVKRIASELTGRPRTLYEFIRRVATTSATCELHTPASWCDLLNEELRVFCALMTESVSSPVSFRYFFEDLITPVQDIIPIAYSKEGGGIGNVIEDIASMLFQTLSKHQVKFEFHSERDFVNTGLCMLCDVENETGICTIMEPWVIQAAMHFFNSHGVDVATKAIDDLLFSSTIPSPQVFGTLFDYRIALTILSHWKGQQVLDNPLFASVKDVEWLQGITLSAIGLRDDRVSPVSTYEHYVNSNFPVRGHKRSRNNNKKGQRDPAYYNHVYMATDRNKNDLIFPLSRGTEVVSVLILGNKISLFEHTKNKQKFSTIVAKSQTLDDVLDVSVSTSDHQNNILQTESQYDLKNRVHGGYIVAHVEFPKTDGVKPGCNVGQGKIVFEVNESNLADFLCDTTFVERLHKHIAYLKTLRREFL